MFSLRSSRALEQPCQERLKPGRGVEGPQRGEPHLPIQARLVRLHQLRRAEDVARLVLELVKPPGLSVVAALYHDFGPCGGHHPKEPVVVHTAQRQSAGVGFAVRFFLPTIAAQALMEITKAIKQSDCDQGQIEVAG